MAGCHTKQRRWLLLSAMQDRGRKYHQDNQRKHSKHTVIDGKLKNTTGILKTATI